MTGFDETLTRFRSWAGTTERNLSGDPETDVAKLSYEYDLGTGWMHEIALQKKLPRSPGAIYPVCVKFSGDSPVEYPKYDDDGEYIGQEPEPFDLAAVNKKLAKMTRNH